jgi:hypothetical protein
MEWFVKDHLARPGFSGLGRSPCQTSSGKRLEIAALNQASHPLNAENENRKL